MKKDKLKLEKAENVDGQTQNTEGKGQDLWWLLSCALITLTAFVLRFWNLELKPLHHDEGVNGHFLTTLFREGVYKYDPANYHGPDLYYIALFFTKLFGLNTLSVRWSVAIFGVLTVIMAFYLKDYIGKTGALFAALFLALSPGMVFISRYFIHEIIFVFLSLALVVSILFFIEKRKAGIFAVAWMALILLVCFLPSALNLANVFSGSTTVLWILRVLFFLVEAVLVFFVIRMLLAWNEGRPIYLILASASTVMLFATKETAFITLGTMLIAVVCVWIWRQIAANEIFDKNKILIIGAAHILLFLIVLNFGREIIDAYGWLHNNFLGEGKVQQGYVFYSIVFLILTSFAAWIVLLFNLWKNEALETDLAEPVELTWTRFRERTGAASNTELGLVTTALTSITIITIYLLWLLWLLVRFVISLITSRESSDVWNKLTLTNVDNAILAFAFLLLVISTVIWFLRRPQKISSDLVLLSIALTTIFLYIGILFFSSFFTYPEGVSKAFEAYAIWTKTGNKDHTQNGTLAYLRWLMHVEAPIFILSALGTLIAFLKARHRFAMFAGLWATGLFLAYTIIPYKTPWLALSFTLPMCVIAGYAINELVNSREALQKILAGVLGVVAIGVLAYQTYDLNFERYDDEEMPYVYAHTRRGFHDLIAQIEYYAEKSGKGNKATIEVVSPDYWAMPWYLKEYKNANFHGQLVDANTAEMIVAKKGDQNFEAVKRYGAHYKFAGEYPLRPGVDLMLLVRRDLADSDAREIHQVEGMPPIITVNPNLNTIPPP